MKTLVAIAALLSVGTPALAQSGASSRLPTPELQPNIPPYKLDSRDFIFPSGLRVIMQPDRSAPIVAITTYFDRGSTSDPTGKEGIAHFVEHLWFKSRHVDGSDVRTWDILSENGCALNASTSNDWTNYMTVCPKSALRTLMKFASLRMTDPVKNVVASEVVSEREVIRNELRMRMENNGGEVLRYVYDRIYGPEHPYHRLTIGTHGSLDNITLEDIQQFTVDHYRPENATIVVVGDFDPQVASSLIYENFDPSLLAPGLGEEHMRWAPRPGVNIKELDPTKPDPDKVFFLAVDPQNPDRRLPLRDTPPKRNTEFGMKTTPKAYNTELGVFDAPIPTRTVILGWSAPGGYQGNDLTMQVAANMLSNQLMFSLWDDPRFIKDPDTRAPDIGCWAQPSKANTSILCFGSVREGPDGAQLAEKMLDQVSEMWNPEMMHNPQVRALIESNFSRTRMFGLQGVLSNLDRVAGLYGARATDIAGYAHHTGNHQYHSDMMRQFAGLKFEAAMNFAQAWLGRDRAASVVLNPLPEDDLVLDNSESDYHGAQRSEDRVVSTIPADQITEDLIRSEVTLPKLSENMREEKLENGMRVIIMEHGEVPWMTARLVSAGGAATDLMGMDTATSWFRYDPRWDNDGRQFKLEPMRIAGNWQDGRTDEYSFLGINAPSGNVEQALWLLRQRVDQIRPDTTGRTITLREQMKRQRRRWRSRTFWVRQATNELMGHDHPAFKRRDLRRLQGVAQAQEEGHRSVPRSQVRGAKPHADPCGEHRRARRYGAGAPLLRLLQARRRSPPHRSARGRPHQAVRIQDLAVRRPAEDPDPGDHAVPHGGWRRLL